MTEEQSNRPVTIANLVDTPEDAGPVSGLGGWGFPLGREKDGQRPQVGPIIGYCFEKITQQFMALRNLSLENAELKNSLQISSFGRPGKAAKKKESANRKKASEALQALQDNLNSATLLGLTADEDLLKELDFDEKSQTLTQVLNFEGGKDHNWQSGILAFFRTTKGQKEFQELVEVCGGVDSITSQLDGSNLGIFTAMLERFQVTPWHPPFKNPIFSAPPEGREDQVKSDDDLLNEFKGYVDEGLEDMINDDHMERFILGDITASDLIDFSRDDLYMIAGRGYDQLQEGKLDAALLVFEGLVYLDPYDAYFHALVGSVRHKQDDLEGALTCYNQALTLQPWNVNALANRGELLFNQGKLVEALHDFQGVLELDPEDENPGTIRVKTLLMVIYEEMKNQGVQFEQAPQAEEAPQTEEG